MTLIQVLLSDVVVDHGDLVPMLSSPTSSIVSNSKSHLIVNDAGPMVCSVEVADEDLVEVMGGKSHHHHMEVSLWSKSTFRPCDRVKLLNQFMC
jgi:hypothetical protein